MIVILSSAKTLDLDTSDVLIETSQPVFQKEAREVNSALAKLNSEEISELMSISPKLSQQVCGFISAFAKPKIKKPAIYTYSGVVYQQIEVASYSKADLQFAERTLRTVSGLYGILRPLDEIAPYRLEMGAGLAVKKSANLYDFWQKKVTALINKDIEETKAKCLLNLASKEYSRVVDSSGLKAPFINIDFKEKQGAKLKTVGLLAKVARGKMANYIVQQRIVNPQLLKKYDIDGYSFKAKLSDDNNFVFVR